MALARRSFSLKDRLFSLACRGLSVSCSSPPLVGWLLYWLYWPLPPLKLPLPPRPQLGALVRLRSIGTAVFCIHRGAFDELYCGLLLNGGFLGGPRKLFRGRFCLWGKF